MADSDSEMDEHCEHQHICMRSLSFGLGPAGVRIVWAEYQGRGLLHNHIWGCGSADKIQDDAENELAIPVEYLNTLTPSGVPPHKLRIKKGLNVMLM